jgi:hypothetical protein
MYTLTRDGLAEEEAMLQQQVHRYRLAAYSDCTKVAYRCQIRQYLAFCTKFGYTAVPASSETLCKYAAHLASTMKATSVKQYMNVIKLLHLESGLSNPLEGDWFLCTVLKGINRLNSSRPQQKLPLTIDILKRFPTVLNLCVSKFCSFWAASLVAFFGMMRKSSLFPRKETSNHMQLGNCVVYDWGIIIRCSYSKTIQNQEREVFIALPCNSVDMAMCPVRALFRAAQLANSSSPSDKLFMYTEGTTRHCMTYHTFTCMLKQVLQKLGLPLKQYSGHSFRRGGACHALLCKMPAEIIKAQGDWRSLSYLDYVCSTDHAQRADYIKYMY